MSRLLSILSRMDQRSVPRLSAAAVRGGRGMLGHKCRRLLLLVLWLLLRLLLLLLVGIWLLGQGIGVVRMILRHPVRRLGTSLGLLFGLRHRADRRRAILVCVRYRRMTWRRGGIGVMNRWAPRGDILSGMRGNRRLRRILLR